MKLKKVNRGGGYPQYPEYTGEWDGDAYQLTTERDNLILRLTYEVIFWDDDENEREYSERMAMKSFMRKIELETGYL